MSRFTTARGKYGTPLVYDSEGRRPVAVFLREWGDEDVVPEAADVAAMQKAKICAQAFNRVHDELTWAKQNREGGK